MMLTRRCHARELRLRPSDETNDIILYVAGVMAQKHETDIHVLTALSNHWHPVVTDPKGKIVGFKRDCHSFITRALNTTYNDRESMWSSAQTSKVVCEAPEDIIDRMAYSMANPVAARLVRYGHHWPGVRIGWPHPPITIKRPRKFFRGPEAGGEWPDEVTITFKRPPGYDHLGDDELAELVNAAIEQAEDEARAEADANGEGFLGRRNVLKQSRYARAVTPEPMFKLSPTIGAKDRSRRIKAILRDRFWRDDYEAALGQWRAGNRDVVFPYGTYLMRAIHGARVAPPPD